MTEDNEERKAAPPAPDINTWQIINAPVAKLFVDRRYQRGLVKGQVRRLVEGWDWDKYEPINISHRSDGRYAVTAGQQRTHAAIELGIESLPAILRTRTGIVQEAKSYLGSGEVANITASDRFKARLIANDEKAFAIWQMVEHCGFGLRCIREDEEGWTSDPFCIEAVYALETIFDTGYLEKTLTCISASWGNQPVKDMVQGNMLRGVYMAIRHLEQHNVNAEQLANQLSKVTVKEVLDKGYDRYRSMVTGRSIDAGVAAVVVDQYNYRRREQVPEFSKQSVRRWTGKAGADALSREERAAIMAKNRAAGVVHTTKGAGGRFVKKTN